MNKDFYNWLKEQEYTLTDNKIFTYVWDEVTHAADQNNRHKEIYRIEYTWGLWRKKYE